MNPSSPMVILAQLILGGTISLVFPPSAREIIKEVTAANDPIYRE
jgi:hypothetical protein